MCGRHGLGIQDHMTWKGGERDMMADWVFDGASSDTYRVEDVRVFRLVTNYQHN